MGMCIAQEEKIPRRAEDSVYDGIVARLLLKPNARGVVMFADEDETRSVVSLFSRPASI